MIGDVVMNHTIRNQKEYIDGVKQIYRNKEFDGFKENIREYYKNADIKHSWMVKRLRKLLKGDKIIIDIIVFIIGNLLSALVTTLINANAIKEIHTSDLNTQVNAFVFILIVMILIALSIWLFTIILSAPVAMYGISSTEIKRRKIEIDIICKKINRQEIITVLRKDDKKVLLKELILGSLLGTIAPVVATVVVLFFM